MNVFSGLSGGLSSRPILFPLPVASVDTAAKTNSKALFPEIVITKQTKKEEKKMKPRKLPVNTFRIP